MVENTRNDLFSGFGGSIAGIREVVGRPTRSSSGLTTLGGQGNQATPDGPRGRRMLAADTPLDSLDRSAPRGSYLDILV